MQKVVRDEVDLEDFLESEELKREYSYKIFWTENELTGSPYEIYLKAIEKNTKCTDGDLGYIYLFSFERKDEEGRFFYYSSPLSHVQAVNLVGLEKEEKDTLEILFYPSMREMFSSKMALIHLRKNQSSAIQRGCFQKEITTFDFKN